MRPAESIEERHDRQASSPDGHVASTDADSSMSEAIKLGEQLLDCVAGMVTLARLESLLAVKTLPRVLALWLLMLPLMLLTWISFSLLLSWVAYEYLMGALWGFTAFFVLQCIAVASSYFVLQAYKRRMTLPHTRKHLASALRSVQHEFKKAHQEQQ